MEPELKKAIFPPAMYPELPRHMMQNTGLFHTWSLVVYGYHKLNNLSRANGRPMPFFTAVLRSVGPELRKVPTRGI